ncbi:MAG: polysaccharide deacetylase family protein [Bacteroidota bacterium]
MFVKSPSILKKIFPQLIWSIKTNKKEIYLTFDDGPHPEITPQVLKILNSFNVKATFFCVGENVEKYPDTFELIINNGHKAGNHSYNHLNGWKTSNANYFNNIEKADVLINSNLLRPPYGRIALSQIKPLSKKYSIIMWTVLTYDYDSNVSKEKCLHNSINKTKQGSIVVFHDSLKSADNMLYALPLFLKHFLAKGYSFGLLK